MKPCRQFESTFVEIASSGVPADSSGLRPELEHLRRCPECRAYLHALQYVEKALRCPLDRVPDPSLTDRILARIYAEKPIEVEAWRLLPAAVWLPSTALVIALFMAFVLMPGNALTGLMLDAEPLRLVKDLSVGAGGLRHALERDLFWPVWSGIAVTLAGVGLSLFLSKWDDISREEVIRFEEQARDAAARVARMARRVRP